jgi:CDGSH-type Zn-finger protein
MCAVEVKKGKWIEIEENGPYIVHGNIPLVRKTQVVSEHGEPIAWQKTETIETSGVYKLCRCGQTSTPPFCDMTHMEEDFDGTETAPTNTFAERHHVIEGGAQIEVKRDHSLCMESGFCGTRFEKLEQMVARTGDINVRSQVIAMIERCPSGSFTYSVRSGQPDIEPDLPRQIAITTEITDEGPIPGPIWVTGNIPIERSDGQPFETRNRVTLCCCGLSKIKPLCDSTHRESETEKLRKK